MSYHSAFEIGRSALFASQAAIQIAGPRNQGLSEIVWVDSALSQLFTKVIKPSLLGRPAKKLSVILIKLVGIICRIRHCARPRVKIIHYWVRCTPDSVCVIGFCVTTSPCKRWSYVYIASAKLVDVVN